MFVDITQQCFVLLTQVNFPANNLNFHWSRRWWDRIQAIFLNLFYFNIKLYVFSYIFSISKSHQLWSRTLYTSCEVSSHWHCFVLAKSEWKLEKQSVCKSSKLDCDHEKQSRKKEILHNNHNSCITIKVIIYRSRGEPFLWNRIWDLGWFWAGWQYWKFFLADYEQLLMAVFSCFHRQKKLKLF